MVFPEQVVINLLNTDLYKPTKLAWNFIADSLKNGTFIEFEDTSLLYEMKYEEKQSFKRNSRGVCSHLRQVDLRIQEKDFRIYHSN